MFNEDEVVAFRWKQWKLVQGPIRDTALYSSKRRHWFVSYVLPSSLSHAPAMVLPRALMHSAAHVCTSLFEMCVDFGELFFGKANIDPWRQGLTHMAMLGLRFFDDVGPNGNGITRLYDMHTDPRELKDLSKDRADVVRVIIQVS